MCPKHDHGRCFHSDADGGVLDVPLLHATDGRQSVAVHARLVTRRTTRSQWQTGRALGADNRPAGICLFLLNTESGLKTACI